MNRSIAFSLVILACLTTCACGRAESAPTHTPMSNGISTGGPYGVEIILFPELTDPDRGRNVPIKVFLPTSGVFCVLLGEAVLLGSPPVLVWFLIFLCGNAIYIPLVEERGLERRFGQDYVMYKQHVPRWIPRREPWRGLES